MACCTSKFTAQRVIAMTRRVQAQAPDVWDAWVAGDIDQDKVERVNRALRRLQLDSSKALLNALVVDVAVCKTPEILGRWLNQFILETEKDLQDERLRRSAQDRYVSVRPDLDGMSFLTAELSAVDAHAIDQVLTALAGIAEPGDTRTVQQRRADALVDVLLRPGHQRVSRGVGHQHRHRRPPRRPQRPRRPRCSAAPTAPGLAPPACNRHSDSDSKGRAVCGLDGGQGQDEGDRQDDGDRQNEGDGDDGFCSRATSTATATVASSEDGQAANGASGAGNDQPAGAANDQPAGAANDQPAGDRQRRPRRRPAGRRLRRTGNRPGLGRQRLGATRIGLPPRPTHRTGRPRPGSRHHTGPPSTARQPFDRSHTQIRDLPTRPHQDHPLPRRRTPTPPPGHHRHRHHRPIPVRIQQHPRPTHGPLSTRQRRPRPGTRPPTRHPVLPAPHRRQRQPPHVTELGRFPSRKLAIAIKFRDGTCTGPTCTTPATRCDIDHLIPVPEGETTART